MQRFSREFPRGTVLFREGDPGGDMYVVNRGKVSVRIGPSGVSGVGGTAGSIGPGE